MSRLALCTAAALVALCACLSVASASSSYVEMRDGTKLFTSVDLPIFNKKKTNVTAVMDR